MRVKFNLRNFVSPVGEVSYYKGIPIQYKKLVTTMLKNRGYKFRIRFRGPRHYAFMAAYCRESYAKTFAVYAA